jgi:hypothetical protein
MWPSDLLQKKAKALLIHAALGALILLPVWAWLDFSAYPDALFWTDGGWQGLKILLMVDLVLGPTLTFMVFNPSKSKKALLVDFSVIAVLQVAALAYGLHNIYQKRPCAVAWFDGAFQVATCDSFKTQDIALDGWQKLGAKAPYWVFVRKPVGDEQAGVLAFEMTGGLLASDLHFLYDPLPPHLKTLQPQWPSGLKTQRDALKKQYPSAHVLPLLGYYHTAVLALDDQGRVLGWAQ